MSYKGVEKEVDRKVMSFMAKKHTALKLVLYIVGVFVLGASIAVGLTMLAQPAAAHSGGVSPKDDCHKSKKLKERHWHKEGTRKRGGPCVKVRGKTYQFINNAICAEERVELTKNNELADEGGWSARRDAARYYRRIAENLRDCIANSDRLTK